jgi:hypothetical protein
MPLPKKIGVVDHSGGSFVAAGQGEGSADPDRFRRFFGGKAGGEKSGSTEKKQDAEKNATSHDAEGGRIHYRYYIPVRKPEQTLRSRFDLRYVEQGRKKGNAVITKE